MRKFKFLLVTGVFLLLSGAAFGQDYSEAAIKQADSISGEQTWQQYCAFCRTVRADQADMSGPNLHQLFKRKVGTKPGFSYSQALQDADQDWTPQLFADYVQDPGATLPGNVMPAVNIPADKVFALTAYVMRISASVPDYWTFLFDNTSRYEIKVNGETVIVDAQFNKDKTITSPQGASGVWRTEGSAGKDDRMCYYLIDVPGVDGQLSECFALVLMFNPRMGARWPSRFEQGNSYWAEITEGRK